MTEKNLLQRFVLYLLLYLSFYSLTMLSIADNIIIGLLLSLLYEQMILLSDPLQKFSLI